MAEHILDIQNLNVAFSAHGQRRVAVEDVSFHVKAGEILCLVGESGSGKTVSALAAMNLLPHTASIDHGTLLFCGQDILSMPEHQRRKIYGAQMTMIFQEPMTSLNPVFKVGEQVAEVLKAHIPHIYDKACKARVIDLFDKVRLPDPHRRYHAYPNQLSGGQRQRIMIAMALAMDTKLLIADEPTTALDVTVQGEILNLIKHLQKEFNLSVLFITHDFGVVKELADRVAVMQHGRIVEQGPVERVIQAPKHPYTQDLLKAMPTLNMKKGKNKEARGEILFRTEKLSKTFEVRKAGMFSPKQTFAALSNVNLTLRKGETVGLVGESGCGKSTLARCLLRIYRPSAGQVLYKGLNTAPLKGRELKNFRRHVQMVFQDPFSSLNPRMRIGESVGEGIRAHKLMKADERKAFVLQLLADCGLPEDTYSRFPHEFSGGQRQRICIARALALRPDVIIADEPVSALDVSVQKQILKLMDTLKKKYNLTYLFISHDLRVVSQICDRVIVMRDGHIVEEGPTWQIFQEPQHVYTQDLLAAIPGDEKAA